DQVGNAGEAVDLEHPVGVLLPVVEGAARQAAQQVAGLVVAQLPGVGQAEEARQRRARQALAFGPGIQVDELRRLEAAGRVGVGEAHGKTPYSENITSDYV